MKKTVLSIMVFVSVMLVGHSKQAEVITIADYKPEYKDAIMEIGFQDPELFCPGRELVPVAMRSMIDAETKKEFAANCDNPLACKKVLLDANGSVIAFVVFYRTHDSSLETFRRKNPEATFTDEQLLTANPTLKRTDAECENYILLEGIAVSQEHRGKGYGHMLIKVALEESKLKWPEVDVIHLHVNANNSVARGLYASTGFVVSKEQPQLMVMIKAVQYEKSLRN